jgi:hypothetical protein
MASLVASQYRTRGYSSRCCLASRAIAREGHVRILKHIWRDLRHGDNIDLYPVIVISLIATVLSLLGIASQKLILSLLLALVELLAIAMLVNRRQNEQLTRILVKLGDSTVLSQRFLRKEDRVDEVARRIRMAREVWLWGTTLSAHIPALEEVIRSNLESGLVSRVLLVQPHSSAVSMAAFRAGRMTDTDLDADLQRNLSRLLSMSSAGRLEYRVIDYLGPYVLYIFDPSAGNGHAIIRLTNFRAPPSTDQCLNSMQTATPSGSLTSGENLKQCGKQHLRGQAVRKSHPRKHLTRFSSVMAPMLG